MSAGALLLSLLAAALKAGLLLALAGGIVSALRRAPARARHSIWAGALVGALLVPVVAPWMPDWTIVTLPSPLFSERSAPVAAHSRPAPSRSTAFSRPANRAELEIPTSTVATPRQAEASVAAELPALWTRVARVPPASWSNNFNGR